MRFEPGNKVVIKATEEVGRVQVFKNGSYKINFSDYLLDDWFLESELDWLCEFDNKFEKGLIDLLINVYLKAKNLNMVKCLYDEKQKLS